MFDKLTYLLFVFDTKISFQLVLHASAPRFSIIICVGANEKYLGFIFGWILKRLTRSISEISKLVLVLQKPMVATWDIFKCFNLIQPALIINAWKDYYSKIC